MVAIDLNNRADTGDTAPRLYRVGWFRKVVLSFLVLLLLPFYVSLAPMLMARFAHGFPMGTGGLLLIGLAMTLIISLLVLQLIYAVRAKVELGQKAFRAVLPVRALSPRLTFDRRELAYEDVRAVEVRREVFGAPLAPVLMLGARVIPREGSPIILGFVNEKNIDPVFPVPEIAEEIARRSGIQLTEAGTVRRSVPHKMLGLVDPYAKAPKLEANDLDVLSRRHDRLMIALVVGLVALVLFGIGADYVTEHAQQASPTPAVTAPKSLKK